MYLHFIFYIKTISPGSMAFPVKWFGSFFRNASWASVGATAAQSQRRKGGDGSANALVFDGGFPRPADIHSEVAQADPAQQGEAATYNRPKGGGEQERWCASTRHR
jgi:hypothetical protein